MTPATLNPCPICGAAMLTGPGMGDVHTTRLCRSCGHYERDVVAAWGQRSCEYGARPIIRKVITKFTQQELMEIYAGAWMDWGKNQDQDQDCITNTNKEKPMIASNSADNCITNTVTNATNTTNVPNVDVNITKREYQYADASEFSYASILKDAPPHINTIVLDVGTVEYLLLFVRLEFLKRFQFTDSVMLAGNVLAQTWGHTRVPYVINYRGNLSFSSAGEDSVPDGWRAFKVDTGNLNTVIDEYHAACSFQPRRKLMVTYLEAKPCQST